MKIRRIIAIACLSFSLLGVNLTAYAADASPHQTISALFIGNSFTYVNNLPATIAALAESKGDKLQYSMVAAGGVRLEQHAQNVEIKKQLNAQRWMYVILQEQSQLSALPNEQFNINSLPYAAAIDQMAHQLNPSTKTLLYMTWGYVAGDQSNCISMQNFCSYEEMQKSISNNFYKMEKSLNASVAPVGIAWFIIRKSHPEINLYAADGIHPSKAGTYLAACVFYSTLFHKSAKGVAILEMDAKTADILQSSADEAVFNERN